MTLSVPAAPAGSLARFSQSRGGLVALLVWSFIACRPHALANSSEPQPRFGRASFQVTFPESRIGRREPLVVSGGGQDVLYAWYSGKNEIRIGFHHLGFGGPVSPPVAIEPGRAYDLELNLGSFYPPDGHPSLADWEADSARQLRRQLAVMLDGKFILNDRADFYPTSPDDIHFGLNPGPYVTGEKFSGTLRFERHHGLPVALGRPLTDMPVALRLTLRFPEFTGVSSEPLISTGGSHAGDLLYVTYVAPGQLRFGHDAWNGGAVETATVDYEAGKPQTLELQMPAFTRSDSAAETHRFILRYNGTLLLAEQRPLPADDSDKAFLGFNGNDSTAAATHFSGEIERAEPMTTLPGASDQFQLEPGPVRLMLRFPHNALGHSEPLLITGRTSAADILFVQYVDAGHIRIGFDHWSKGGPLSPPIPIDYGVAHALEIHLGSLYPPAEDPAWGDTPAALRERALDTVLVKLNGRTVIDHQERAYPSKPEDILTGLNTVGATTCGSAFTGRIFVQERLGLSALK